MADTDYGKSFEVERGEWRMTAGDWFNDGNQFNPKVKNLTRVKQGGDYVAKGEVVFEIAGQVGLQGGDLIVQYGAPIDGYVDYAYAHDGVVHPGEHVCDIYPPTPISRAEFIERFEKKKASGDPGYCECLCSLSPRDEIGGKDQPGQSTIVKWHVQDCSHVRYGDLLLTFEKDGVLHDVVMSREHGTIAFLAREGQTVGSNDEIAYIMDIWMTYRPFPTNFGQPYRAIWEGCRREPKTTIPKTFTTEEVMAKAQELFDNTQPRGHIPLDRCIDQVSSYFTAWAKRVLEA
jgi:hypothetical protein